MPHKKAKFSDRQKDRAAKGHDLAPPSGSAYLRDMPKGAMRILNAAQIQDAYHARKRAQKEAAQEAPSGPYDGKGSGKGKARKEGSSASGPKTEGEPLKIKPGEKMGEFSRRVEAAMAKDIHTTMRAANDSSTGKKRKRRAEREKEQEETERREHDAVAEEKRAKARTKASHDPDRQALKQERQRLEQKREGGTQASSGQDRDWAKAEQRRRVRDVVQAPPKLTRAPRGESDAALLRKAQLKAALSGRDASAAAQTTVKKARLPDPVARPGAASEGGLRRRAVLEDERTRAIQLYREAKEQKLRQRPL